MRKVKLEGLEPFSVLGYFHRQPIPVLMLRTIFTFQTAKNKNKLNK